MEGAALKWITLFADTQQAAQSVPEGSIVPIYLKLQDKRIAITRLQGTFYAFDNRCPHKDVPLHTGHITSEGGIVCKLHSYVWALGNGTQISGEPCGELKVYPIKVAEEGKVKIGLY